MDRFVVALIVIIGGITSVVLYEIFSTPIFSVTEKDPTKAMGEYMVSDIQKCSQIIKINSSYATCVLLKSNVTGFDNLPTPIFKWYGARSTYGPAPHYNMVRPTSLLSQEQIDHVIDVIRNDPEIKSEPFAWKVLFTEPYPSHYSWYDDVRLVIDGIRSSPSADCGWVSTVTIDLNTLTIVERDNTKIMSYVKC